jgi:hypothetical protein
MSQGQGFGGSAGYGQNYGNPNYNLQGSSGFGMGYGQNQGNPGYSLRAPSGGMNMGYGQNQGNPDYSLRGGNQVAASTPIAPPPGFDMGYGQNQGNPGYGLNPSESASGSAYGQAPALEPGAPTSWNPAPAAPGPGGQPGSSGMPNYPFLGDGLDMNSYGPGRIFSRG